MTTVHNTTSIMYVITFLPPLIVLHNLYTLLYVYFLYRVLFRISSINRNIYIFFLQKKFINRWNVPHILTPLVSTV